MSLSEIKSALKKESNPSKAEFHKRFFKTGPGQYGEGDIFLGIKVPVIRKISSKFKHLSLADIQHLLKSEIHEERMAALFILVDKFKRADYKEKEKIFRLYVKNLKYVNNWDLVDLSAEKIIGVYLFEKDKSLLLKLSASDNLWERRVSIMSTFYFIKQYRYDFTLKIAAILLNDEHDLIHKAVGWMLREIGNRDLPAEEKFLKKNYKKMPRTMLRYAIEKFPEKKRQAYLKGNI